MFMLIPSGSTQRGGGVRLNPQFCRWTTTNMAAIPQPPLSKHITVRRAITPGDSSSNATGNQTGKAKEEFIVCEKTNSGFRNLSQQT